MKRLIIIACFLIASLNSLTSGEENLLMRQTPLVYPSGSCTDRCHVNYLHYRTKYKEGVFLHNRHSPLQNIECCECHTNDPANTETHGDLIIEETGCKKCHHNEAKNEDCLKCHSAVNDYRNGSFRYADIHAPVTVTPDWMYKAVLCTDCHKQEENSFLFRDIRSICIECHNDDYGLLYDKWKAFLREGTQPVIRENNNGTKMEKYVKQIQQYGIHNIQLSRMLLKGMQKERGPSAQP